MDGWLIASFLAAALALTIAPGPDNLYVLAQSATYGPKQGLATAFGLCSGILFHIAMAVFGLAVLVRQSEELFWIIKIVGIVYLLYLAFDSIKERCLFNQPFQDREG
ncbi:LysE family translocator [Shouchella shacheensis]|uniref:LysE family translocator n=1 Tax=Shouchella shacheensis TaxID=1649580 RepID=UPI0007403F69|nr:LysE family translocator [Shouchella shacheensis]